MSSVNEIYLCVLLAGPSSVQYQHGTPVLYQAQSGSPPATGMPRVSLSATQQGPTGHSPVPLAPGIPQQQQVMSPSHISHSFLLHGLVIWIRSICAGDYSGSGGGARGWDTKAGQLFVHPRGSQGPWEAAERWQCRVSQVTPPIPSPHRQGPNSINGTCVSSIFFILHALTHLCFFYYNFYIIVTTVVDFLKSVDNCVLLLVRTQIYANLQTLSCVQIK